MRCKKDTITKGFTLVELLITISLIAILSGVLFSVINPMGIQKKARDSQRVSDLTKIKVALENYFADNRAYPVKSDAWGKIGNSPGETLFVLKGNYINNLPADPKPTGTDCVTSGWRNYFYRSSSDGSKYALVANFEVSPAVACPSQVSAICIANPACSGTGMYYTTAD